MKNRTDSSGIVRKKRHESRVTVATFAEADDDNGKWEGGMTTSSTTTSSRKQHHHGALFRNASHEEKWSLQQDAAEQLAHAFRTIRLIAALPGEEQRLRFDIERCERSRLSALESDLWKVVHELQKSKRTADIKRQTECRRDTAEAGRRTRRERAVSADSPSAAR